MNYIYINFNVSCAYPLMKYSQWIWDSDKTDQKTRKCQEKKFYIKGI